jgi:hypothetical protein
MTEQNATLSLGSKDESKRTSGRTAASDRKEGVPERRIPMSGQHRDILGVQNTNPRYHYRWVNDKTDDGAYIYRYTQAGYEFAPREEEGYILSIGQGAVYKGGNKRSIIRIPASKHDSEQGYLYLMRIKREFYEEDQKSEQDEIRRQELAVASDFGEDNSDSEFYGTVTIGNQTQD